MSPDSNQSNQTSTFARRDLLKKGMVGASSSALGVAAFSGNSLAGCTGPHKCARTPGFWKNHTDMWHGGNHLHLGTAGDESDRYNYFSAFQGRPSVLEILERPPKGDKSLIMATHLIATLLNVKAGTDASCIWDTIQAAREWLDNHPIGSQQRHWDGGESIKDTLDAYNNGRLCACKAE